MTEKNKPLTLGELIKETLTFKIRTELLGASAEYRAKFDAIKAEIPKHYSIEEWENLSEENVLHSAIAEKYFEFKNYHNDNHQDTPVD